MRTGGDALLASGLMPAELVAFLDAGAPPVYVGFGSMAAHAPKDIARVAIEAIRAQGHRVLLARGWADLALIDDRDDCFVVGEVNQQALFGRVADLGIGTAHDGPTPTFDSLSAALTTVLTPETRARAGGRGQHDPHRRRDGGRETAARHTRPEKGRPGPRDVPRHCHPPPAGSRGCG
ncbi:hypothetical protein GCM10020000_75950 [Streptomyces olivoverticillatus]